MARGLAVAAVACASLVAPGAAQAHHTLDANASFVVKGKPWPGRTVARITYFDASEVKWAVKAAAQAWNSSGVNVRFVPAPRSRAKLLIVNEAGPRSDETLHGTGTLGYVRPGALSFFFDRNGRPQIKKLSNPNRVTLSRLRHPKRRTLRMAGIATHELGHVLGLDHENGECATMNSFLWDKCRGARPCRLLERDDIEGAARLYGGRVQMKRPRSCPKPPREVRRVGDPREYAITLEWRNPRGGLFDHMVVEGGPNKCPRKPSSFGGSPTTGNRPGKIARAEDDDVTGNSGLRRGRYCYSFWGSTFDGVLGRRKTVWVDFDPPRPTAPTQLHVVLGSGGEATVSWSVAPHPALEFVAGAGAIGRCPTDPDDGIAGFQGEAGESTARTYLPDPGRYCFAAWSIDSAGETIGPPATVFIDYAGQPPIASFDYFPESLTAYFVNNSYDQDGEIVSYQWDFGDGATSSESDPQHTYAGPGTYTVRLTVTDDRGLTGTTTQQVAVSDG